MLGVIARRSSRCLSICVQKVAKIFDLELSEKAFFPVRARNGRLPNTHNIVYSNSRTLTVALWQYHLKRSRLPKETTNFSFHLLIRHIEWLIELY